MLLDNIKIYLPFLQLVPKRMFDDESEISQKSTMDSWPWYTAYHFIPQEYWSFRAPHYR